MNSFSFLFSSLSLSRVTRSATPGQRLFRENAVDGEIGRGRGEGKGGEGKIREGGLKGVSRSQRSVEEHPVTWKSTVWFTKQKESTDRS